jgi:dolichyl-phosphate beta-glucosyltransferase
VVTERIVSPGASTGGSVHLVVPVYNEAARLADYLGDLVAFVRRQPPGSHLCFVDDGSVDGTVEQLERGLRDTPRELVSYVRRPHLGKGAALQAGLLASQAEVAAFCDVDLSTDLADLEGIMATAAAADVLAIGSRALRDSEISEHESRVREWLGRTYNMVLRSLLTPGVADTQCGAKAARSSIWRSLLPHCRQQGFAWDAELVAVALATGVEVREMPVRWRHDHRTKVRLLRDGLAMVRETPQIMRSARAAQGATRTEGGVRPGA